MVSTLVLLYVRDVTHLTGILSSRESARNYVKPMGCGRAGCHGDAYPEHDGAKFIANF